MFHWPTAPNQANGWPFAPANFYACAVSLPMDTKLSSPPTARTTVGKYMVKGSNFMNNQETSDMLEKGSSFRHRAIIEEKLRKSQELLQGVINGTTDMVYVKDLNGLYLMINNAMVRYSGKNSDEVIGKDGAVFQSPDVVNILRKHDKEVMNSGDTTTFKETSTDATGKLYTFLSTKGPLHDAQGRTSGIFGISRDITNTIEAEATLVENQEQLHSLAIELSRVEERERRRYATELHDHLGQNLAFIKMQLNAITCAKGSSECAKRLAAAIELVDDSIQEVRSLTFQLSPPLLYEVGFEPALEWLAEQFREQHGLQVEIIHDGEPLSLDEEIRTTLFHIVRELLVNIVKHADTMHAYIFIDDPEDTVAILVIDAGTGFNVEQVMHRQKKESGFGLFNVQQKIKHLGGNFTIESEPGKGTQITLQVPVKIHETSKLEGPS